MVTNNNGQEQLIVIYLYFNGIDHDCKQNPIGHILTKCDSKIFYVCK